MIATITELMVWYNGTDIRQIDHALKVAGYAALISQMEDLEPALVERITLAALLHDIGMREAAARYGSAAGKFQELEGPLIAAELMADLDIPQSERDRICFLVGHHHTIGAIDGVDLRVLVEAHCLVHATEDDVSGSVLQSLRSRVFRTASGTALFESMYADRLVGEHRDGSAGF